MGVGQAIVDQWLDRAVEGFREDHQCARTIRRLAAERPEEFARSALRHLTGKPPAEAEEGRLTALRLIATLLARNPNVYSLLTEESTAESGAGLAAFRRMLEVDPLFDVKLAKQLPDRTGINHAGALKSAKGSRALQLLDAGSRGQRLVFSLLHLTESDDTRLCSKATLFVGRRVNNPAWTRRQLNKGDERVRANALESLWGRADEESRRVMQMCVRDGSNRVAGNAVVGLHMTGERGTRDEVLLMATTREARFRATAAWAMGRFGEEQYIESLGALCLDDSEMVRRAATQSLLAIRGPEKIEPEIEAAQAEPVAHLEAVAVAEEEPMLLVEPPRFWIDYKRVG